MVKYTGFFIAISSSFHPISLSEILFPLTIIIFIFRTNHKQNDSSPSSSLRCQKTGVISIFLCPATIIYPCVMAISSCQLDQIWN